MAKKANMTGFVDFNKFTLDKHVEYLKEYFKFDSSGVAKSVSELIKFYEDNKQKE